MMKLKYNDSQLQGFDHPHNTTILNERAVELAIAFDWLDKVRGVGLEVGNVMARYNCTASRRIVDKYESYPGVDNLDVFEIQGSYDWILSVSTLEHVGQDEGTDPHLAVDAFAHLHGLLNQNGSMLITVPNGYNIELDANLNDLDYKQACTFVRDGKDGWIQSAPTDMRPYGMTTKWAESVWIAEFEGK